MADVTRFFYLKQANGEMSETPTHLGAKAENVTIQPAEGEALLNAQSEFERMWQVDSDLDDKIDKEIEDREQAIIDEATARSNADNALQTNIYNEAEARANADTAEKNAREAAIAAEQKARDDADKAEQKVREDADKAEEEARKKAVQDLADALEKAVGDLAADIEGAIDSARETANGMVTELDNDLQAQIDSLDTQVDALAEIALVEEEQLITEETNVPFVETEKAYKYILVNCSYNGNRLPVQKILADGEPTELVFYSVGEEELLYYSLKATVAEGGLGITDMKANSEAEFKILSIYGCN